MGLRFNGALRNGDLRSFGVEKGLLSLGFPSVVSDKR